MHLLQHRHGSRAQQQQLCSYSSDLELNRCHFTFDYSKKWWGKYKKNNLGAVTWHLLQIWQMCHNWLSPVSFLRLYSCQKSGDRRKFSAEWLQNSPAPHTYNGDFTQMGLGGLLSLALSLSLSRAHHVSMATALTGTTTGSSCYQRFKRKCMWSFQCRDVTQSWSLCSVCLWFMVLRLKFPVAVLQSQL